jgi:hypothetical protein
MGPQIILAMNTTALLCSHQPNRRYIVVCDGTYRRRQCSRSSGVFAPPQRSPSVLFAPPQQQLPRNKQLRLLHSSASFLLHYMCATISNGLIHTRTHRVPFVLSKPRSQPRNAVFCSDATTIITIECHAAQQRNNQQSLSQRQPSQRRWQRQPSQQQTATLLLQQPWRLKPRCSTAMPESSARQFHAGRFLLLRSHSFCYCAHIASAVVLTYL